MTGTIELPEGVEMVMPGDNIKMVFTLIHPDRDWTTVWRFAIREGGRTVRGRCSKSSELIADNI